MKTYILRHTPQKNKDVLSVFQDTKMIQVSAAALRIWSKLEVSPLNTIQLLTNRKVLDLVFDQSQRTHLPIKTPENRLKTSNKQRRSNSLQHRRLEIFFIFTAIPNQRPS